MSDFQYQYPNPYSAYPQPKKKKWPIVLAIVIPVVFVIGIIVFALNMYDNFDISADRTRPVLPSSDYMAILHIEGTISGSYIDGYDHGWVMDEVERMTDDIANIGLILYIDSPGGSIYETDELYFALEEYKELTGRPIYAYGGSMMASGGYYLAATAEEIYCNRNCWTGSIGVTAGTAIDISDFLEDNNIHATTIHAGENKNMGGYFSEFTEDQQAIFQSLVDEAYDQFVEVIVKGRGMNREAVEALADGRIYTAKQALSNQLIDGVGTLDDLKDAIKADLGFEPEYADLEYIYSYSIYDYFWMANQGGNRSFGSTDLGLALSLKDRFTAGPSYLYEALR